MSGLQKYSIPQMIDAKNLLSTGDSQTKSAWDAQTRGDQEFVAGWAEIKKGLATLKGGAEDNQVTETLNLMESTDQKVQQIQADIQEISKAIGPVLNQQLPQVINWLNRHIEGAEALNRA